MVRFAGWARARSTYMGVSSPPAPPLEMRNSVQEDEGRPVFAAKRGVSVEATSARGANLAARRGDRGRIPAGKQSVGDELVLVVGANLDAGIETSLARRADAPRGAGAQRAVDGNQAIRVVWAVDAPRIVLSPARRAEHARHLDGTLGFLGGQPGGFGEARFVGAERGVVL